MLENKFFLKILISYCLIIIAGLGFTSYFITSSMVKNLIDSESKYEKEILQKVAGYTEDRFKIINNIFTLLYIERYHSPNASASIIDLINLYDNNFIRADKKIGAIAININPEIFNDAYKNESRNIKGNVLIMNSSGYVYHDSKGELTGKNSPYEGYKEDSDL